MNIQYPVSEILKSVEGINEPKKKIDKSDYKPSISLNNLDMKTDEEVEELEFLVNNNPDDGSWVGR